jgi:hypothetical protein
VRPVYEAPVGNQPSTSAMTWTVPVPPLKNEAWPSAPTLTITMFGTLWPETKLRFEAVGWAAPLGQTVR